MEVTGSQLEQFIPWCRDFVISHKCLSILVDSLRGPHTQVWPVSSITLRLIEGAGATLKWLQCKKSDPDMAICWSHARKAIWKNRAYKNLRLQPLLQILKEQKYNGQSTQSNLNLKFDVLWLVAPIQLILLITKIQQKPGGPVGSDISKFFVSKKMDQKTVAKNPKNPGDRPLELNATKRNCWAFKPMVV